MKVNPAASKTARVVRAYWIVAGAAVAAVAVAIALNLHWGQEIEATAAVPAALAQSPTCTAGQRPGTAGRHRLRSAGGVPYMVVTPTGYTAARAHPLMVVYAPAGFSAGLSERLAGITRRATEQGFVLAFAGSGPPLSTEALRPLAEIPAEVAARWCIDPSRIVATGHSDGGTIANALAVLPEFRGRVQAIAASGAGWSQTDYIGKECPPPIPVLILHGADDTHFPGFGRASADWWSACNRCTDQDPRDGAGCTRYRGCAAETRYCETPRSHWRWAADAGAVVEFLARQGPGGEGAAQ